MRLMICHLGLVQGCAEKEREREGGPNEHYSQDPLFVHRLDERDRQSDETCSHSELTIASFPRPPTSPLPRFPYAYVTVCMYVWLYVPYKRQSNRRR